MNKTIALKERYVAPYTNIFDIETDTSLLNGSFVPEKGRPGDVIGDDEARERRFNGERYSWSDRNGGSSSRGFGSLW